MTSFYTLTSLGISLRHFFLFILMFISTAIFSQLAIDVSFESSICENDGSISLTILSGEGPFQYALMGEDVMVENESDTLFTLTWVGLFPGDYVLTVIDQTDTITENILIEGNYSPPSIDLEITNQETCEGLSNGEITAFVLNGAMDFHFDLYSGLFFDNPVFIESNTTGVFSNLAAGTYSVVLEDGCFNQTVETIILPVTVFNNDTSLDVVKLSCDSSLLKITNSDMSEFRISAPAEIETAFSDIDSFAISSAFLYDLVVEVRNLCGDTTVVPLNFPVPGILVTTSDIDCNSYSFTIASENLDGPLAYELILPGGDTIFSDTAITLMNAEFSLDYFALVRDTCGLEITEVININNFGSITNVSVAPWDCNLGDAQITVALNTAAIAPVNIQFLSTPNGYEGDTSFIFTVTSDTFILAEQVKDRLISGAYSLSVMDSCGIADTISFDILESDLLNVTFEVSITQDCGDISNLFYAVSNNGSSTDPGTTTLYSIDGGTFSETIANQDSGTFSSLPPGMYVLGYQLCGLEGEVATDTIEIFETSTPIISQLITLNCEGGDEIVILVEGMDGVPDYEYRIQSSSDTLGTYPTDWQSSPLFGPLKSGERYRVQLRDKCGNSASRSISLPTLITPSVVEDYELCENDIVIFRVEQPIEGLEYIWLLNSSILGIGDFVEVPKDEITGPLELETSIPGCSSSSITFTWSGECVGSLPVEWLHFNANGVASFVELEWATALEINNDYFDIQRSVDGINWKSLGTVQGQGTSYEINQYVYNDEKPSPGVNYYRIMQVDFNGSYDYSEVRRVAFDGTGLVSAFPNPFNEVLYLTMDFDRMTEVKEVRITDISGRSWTVSNIEGSRDRLMVETDHLPQGTYFIQVLHRSVYLAPIMIVKH